MENINTDVAIIGAGASGLMAGISAAIEAKRKNKCTKIVVVDHLDRVGKKILVTGNGKCNLSNKNISINNYHSNQPETVKNILNKFSYSYTINLFKSIGLETKEDSLGRVYPRSEQASAVLDLLRLKFKSLSGQEITSFKITEIKKLNSNFIITSNNKNITAKKIIIATGGFTTPTQGCNGTGHSYLKNFGHSITTTFPSLTQIKVSEKIVKSLKGMRTFCKIYITADNNLIKEEIGELQFTENGLSGICAFQLSRIVSEFSLLKTIYGNKYNKIKIFIDLIPELSNKETLNLINLRIKSNEYMILENFLTGIINNRVGQALLKSCGFSFNKKVTDLSEKEILIIANKLKLWEFTPIGTMPFKNAQVTAGGADLSEFNKDTLESKIINGLYACGEILDVDGDCGGFNLQWAWSSGFTAGLNAAKNI